MAIYKSNVILATGAEELSSADISSTNLEPGIHTYDATSIGGYAPIDGDDKHNLWSVLSTRNSSRVQSQIWIPVNSSSITDKNVYVRSMSTASAWGSFIKLTSDYASKSTYGVTKVGDNIDVSNGVISVATGTTTTLGLLKVGTNLSVSSGTVSVPTATTSTLGVVKPSTGLTVSSGTLTANLTNNLTSTSTTSALTAAQGKALDEAKLNLSGGTLTGTLTTSNVVVGGTLTTSAGGQYVTTGPTSKTALRLEAVAVATSTSSWSSYPNGTVVVCW